MNNIADIRTDYKLKELNDTDVDSNAINQFTKWWSDATESKIDEINAATLATATLTGKPSARTVLLKGYDEKGFIFFTNYNSHKGADLAENPQACLVFFWKELQRQVRIEGLVEKVSEADSDAYFNSRPIGSRIGACASPQSKIIQSRKEIEDNVERLNQQFADGNIPRPLHWGGYIIKPQLIEFWQGRPSRLHDRIQYSLDNNGGWKTDRLAP